MSDTHEIARAWHIAAERSAYRAARATVDAYAIAAHRGHS